MLYKLNILPQSLILKLKQTNIDDNKNDNFYELTWSISIKLWENVQYNLDYFLCSKMWKDLPILMYSIKGIPVFVSSAFQFLLFCFIHHLWTLICNFIFRIFFLFSIPLNIIPEKCLKNKMWEFHIPNCISWLNTYTCKIKNVKMFLINF